MIEDRTINFIFAIVTGSASFREGLSCLDLWDYEPGVRFFVNYFIKDRRAFAIQMLGDENKRKLLKVRAFKGRGTDSAYFVEIERLRKKKSRGRWGYK